MNEKDIVFEPLIKHHKFKDYTGKTFGRLTCIGFGGRVKRASIWWCKCECGNVVRVQGPNLSTGHTKSCGCIVVKHRMSGTKEHRTYCAARSRCLNRNRESYAMYGGRGIEFRFSSFQEFLDDVGPFPGDGYSIGRIDNDGHYEPGNVQWETVDQQQNNKSNSHFITHESRTMTIAQWARHLGVPYRRIYSRIRLGWCVDCVLYGDKCEHRLLDGQEHNGVL